MYTSIQYNQIQYNSQLLQCKAPGKKNLPKVCIPVFNKIRVYFYPLIIYTRKKFVCHHFRTRNVKQSNLPARDSTFLRLKFSIIAVLHTSRQGSRFTVVLVQGNANESIRAQRYCPISDAISQWCVHALLYPVSNLNDARGEILC